MNQAVPEDQRPTMVWVGRFQPFHNGHASTLRVMMQHFPLNPIIVAVVSTVGSSAQLPGPGDVRAGREQNPISAFHRVRMISEYIESLDTQQVAALALPRPDLFWPLASDMLPDNRTVCVTVGRNDEQGYEAQKASDFETRGETVVRIQVESQGYASGTKIRQMAQNRRPTSSLMPAAISAYLDRHGLLGR